MTRTMFKGMFYNPFVNEDYSLVGLCLFGQDSVARMDTEFPEAVAVITAAVNRAIDEDAEVRNALSEQKGHTGGVDGFLVHLHAVMKARQDGISAALGGRETPAYLSFYPDGLTGYTQVAKREAPAMMRALSQAVNTHGARLDAETRSALLSLETDWKGLRGTQQDKMGEVGTGRVDKRTAREQLEQALWKACRTVLDKYANDPEKCLSFFREHLLREVSHAEQKDGAADGQA